MKGLWPSSKAEPVSGLSAARPQSLPMPPSTQSAASTMSAMHQPPPVVPSTTRLQSQPQPNGARPEPSQSQTEPPAILSLLPMTGTFERKHITVPYFPEVLRIGRQTNAKTVPTATNGYFDSKVLSRQHAEVWADRNGKIWIRDVKSSNGTFVNGTRLSPENRDSEPHELREHDTLELGIDIVSEDQRSIVHHKVSAKVEHAGIYGSGTNMMDLNFGDLDSSSTNAFMGSAMGQQMSQARGRGGNQSAMGNNSRPTGPQSVMGGNANALGPQRPLNFWMNPITIEQVVKKLTVSSRLVSDDRNQRSNNHRPNSNKRNSILRIYIGPATFSPPYSPWGQEKDLPSQSRISPCPIVKTTDHHQQLHLTPFPIFRSLQLRRPNNRFLKNPIPPSYPPLTRSSINLSKERKLRDPRPQPTRQANPKLHQAKFSLSQKR